MNGRIIVLQLLVIFLFGGIIIPQTKDNMITTKEAYELMNKDSSVVLLDVRTQMEFNGETGHLKNAILIPVQELESRVNELKKYKKNKIIVYCRTGHRSTAGTEILVKNGYNAFNMAGGITKWNGDNLPVVKEKATGH